MCGRFTLRASREEIAEQFSLLELPPISPRYNIAPRQPVGIVRPQVTPDIPEVLDWAPDVEATPVAPHRRREFTFARWGLIPRWAKDPAMGDRLINARAESLATRPAFRAAFRYRRCLVPADGFYEWRQEGRRKQPYFFRLPGDQLFAFAGLWESWVGPDGSEVESCTIITTEANDEVRPFHDRMPVILTRDSFERWLTLEEDHLASLMSLLQPFAKVKLEVFPVGLWVNNPNFDDPRCIAPVKGEGLFG
jgi:putative SOS response-associated peptidase YedK